MTTSPLMDLTHTTEDNLQICDSPSGSSTSEPHDEALLNLQQSNFVDHSLFYKLDQFTNNNNNLLYMQQQQHLRNISPSLSPPLSSHHLTNFVDPLLPNTTTSNDTDQNFWSGFNNAIPNLAKNFTDYISGYSDKQHSLTETSNNTGMQIRVLGVPQTGAKSRVETQIKLCIQLVTDDGDKAQWWSHLKLPEHMVAKDKLRRQVLLSTAPNGTQIANVANLDNGTNATVNPEKMLFLSARVICASDPSRKVLTCLGCIQRERKRSQRRKENKKSDEEDKIKLLEDEQSLAAEEQKILLFNCSEVVDFSSGDTILPTRITCYCRHHNERVGFCIYFELHDHTGKQVAAGMSPPIMITDDHKSNKVKAGRKRPRTDSSAAFSPFDSRQNTSFHFSQQQQYPIQPRPPSLNNPMLKSPSNKPITPPPSTHSPQINNLERPVLQRLIPNEGPTYGGVEVTILGSGFRSGLTCMFGDVQASSTHFWSPNTLVCILPPAAEAGTVVVSFKEYPLVIDSQDVTLFTYYNENDRALMELALQVVGLKMTGKVEDAREIAMRIVQGGNNNQQQPEQQQQQQQHQQQQNMSLEYQIIQVLEVMRTLQTVKSLDISMTGPQGHTMLHFAAMLGFSQLTKMLIDLGCTVNITDKNGFTALHYAAWHNHEKVVSLLLLQGNADPEISNRWNKKPVDLTENTMIQGLLLDYDNQSADIDTSYTEEDSIWLSETESNWALDSDLELPVDEGLRRRKVYTPTIQYLNQEESTSHSADEIMDAEPIHEVHEDTDYEDNNTKEMNWMQRTLSHFQQPTDNSFIQNIIPTKPAELNLKTITDHLLQLPRPMIANVFGTDQEKSREEPTEQALAWYMALAYAMGAKSLVEEEESDTTSDSAQEVYAKRRDKRLFSFWVPLLCCMVIWLFYQFISSHPSMVDSIIAISGFRRQYLSVH